MTENVTYCDKHVSSWKCIFFVVYTPQQNGIVERKNRTLVEMDHTMLDEYKTPSWFWIDAINTACHIINRGMSSQILQKDLI